MSYLSSEMESRVFPGWSYLTMGDGVSLFAHTGGGGWKISRTKLAPHDIKFVLPDNINVGTLQSNLPGTEKSLKEDIVRLIHNLPSCPSNLTDHLYKHLKEQAPYYLGKKIFYKMGISQIFRNNVHFYSDVESYVEFHIMLVPQWIEQSFNRRMVYINNREKYKGRTISLEEEEYLKQSREESLRYLFKGFGHLRLAFPNVLHMELSVITSDNYMICLEKNLHSDYAKVGRGRTASFERSFIVDKHLVINEGIVFIDCYKAALEGLKQEVSVSEEEIEEIVLQSLVIETPNLNTGLVGICKVNISEPQIRERLRNSGNVPHSYGLPIHVSDITEKYLQYNCTVDNLFWHRGASSNGTENRDKEK